MTSVALRGPGSYPYRALLLFRPFDDSFRMKSPVTTLRLFAAALALVATSCTVTRNYADATVTLHTSGGTELGVSTPGGVVFLGNTARSGEVDMTVWFGDGPSIEASIIEPIGSGLYLAQGEIRFPTVEVAFISPQPGDRVFAQGMSFRSAQDLPRDISQVGAGVFWIDPETDRRALIGLISGRVLLSDGTEYIAAVGCEGLWRLIANRRDDSNEGRWTYRDDIL
jgi:hypothetical protein